MARYCWFFTFRRYPIYSAQAIHISETMVQCPRWRLSCTWRRASWSPRQASIVPEVSGEPVLTEIRYRAESEVVQGEDIHEYPYAYLVTAPRFLRYSFNPVSFWYLYNKHKELQAMILEVNNTFDERRMYFLKDSTLDDPDESWTLIDKPPSKFKNTWPKDFHVSPFNSRKGSYALTAQDPFSPHLSATGKVDNTITLISSKAHVKLIARIFSTQPAIDPSTLGCWARLAFIASWWWVGFVTFPRIVREAGKLFFRRKLHVWYRPEVLKDSIGRPATKDEMCVLLGALTPEPVANATPVSLNAPSSPSCAPSLNPLIQDIPSNTHVPSAPLQQKKPSHPNPQALSSHYRTRRSNSKSQPLSSTPASLATHISRNSYPMRSSKTTTKIERSIPLTLTSSCSSSKNPKEPKLASPGLLRLPRSPRP